MVRNYRSAAAKWLAAAVWVFCGLTTAKASEKGPVAADPVAAICPVVYPLDENPSNKGYHYLFYGDAFFINEDGY
ncbi:MAG: hypothetical protein DMG42_04515, partial [Acidobacteria bacterium]